MHSQYEAENTAGAFPVVAVLILWFESKFKHEVGLGKHMVMVFMDCMNLSPHRQDHSIPQCQESCVKMNVGVVADVLTEELHQEMKS